MKLKHITEENIARFERQVGAKPCLAADGWGTIPDKDAKVNLDRVAADDKYVMMINGGGKRPLGIGMIICYDSFWDAFLVGMRIYRDSGVGVSISCKNPNMEVSIGELPEPKESEETTV